LGNFREDFGEDKKINFMKLRAELWYIRNDQIPNNGYVSLLSGEATYVLTVLWLMVLQQVKLQSDLKWEEQEI
jgi:hypothetical protein